MADSFFLTVTGLRMEYWKRSAISPAGPMSAMVLGAAFGGGGGAISAFIRPAEALPFTVNASLAPPRPPPPPPIAALLAGAGAAFAA